MLPLYPPVWLASTPAANRRLCPRDNLAPPSRFYRNSTQLQAYVASSDAGDAFGIAVVRSGDAQFDANARSVTDAAGRLTLDHSSPMYVGASDTTPLHATLSAIVIALELLLSWHGDDAPVILRIAHAPSMAAVAGTWAPPCSLSPLMARVLRLLRETRAQRVYVWLAGFDVNRPYPWGERAIALASYGDSHGWWGDLPPPYANAQPRAPAHPPWSDDTECPVCLDEFDDMWPSGQPKSRAPPGRWACTHAICRACDAKVQAGHNGGDTRCPLCRSQRHVFLQP